MNKQQRNDLHSVIAHGLTSLRGHKLVLEGKITNFEKHLVLSSEHDRQLLTDISLAALKSELEDINNKIEIGTVAMLELEGKRKTSRLYGHGMDEIFMDEGANQDG